MEESYFTLQCHRCECWYPEKFIRPFYTGGENYDVCPSCAQLTFIDDWVELYEEFQDFKEKEGGD